MGSSGGRPLSRLPSASRHHASLICAIVGSLAPIS
jgi:hypothetical protein